MGDADIERMVKDAEEHAEEDKKRRALVDAKNHAESLIHDTEKNVKEYGDKVSPDDKAAIEAAIADAKKALEDTGADAETIKAKTEALTQAAMKLGEAMYKASQAESAGGADAGAAGGNQEQAKDDNVVDADFEEVDPDHGKK